MATYYKMKEFPNTVRHWANGKEFFSKQLLTQTEFDRCPLSSDLFDKIECSQRMIGFVTHYFVHGGWTEYRVMIKDFPNLAKKHKRPEKKQPETLAQYLGRKLLPKR